MGFFAYPRNGALPLDHPTQQARVRKEICSCTPSKALFTFTHLKKGTSVVSKDFRCYDEAIMKQILRLVKDTVSKSILFETLLQTWVGI